MALLSLSPGHVLAGVPCHLSGRRRGGGGGPRRREEGGLKIRAQEAGGDGAAENGSGGDEDFDARLARLQRRATSGTGKKAEMRKARKEGADPYATTAPKSSGGSGVLLSPVPLREPAADGLDVALGATPYTERLHGRLAALGLAAVLLVELATGDRFVGFHDNSTLFVQVYAIFAAAAIFVKFEKEKSSVWPN